MYAFFAGGGAVKFVKDYAAAGLNKTIPLYGPGFLTDGTLDAQGEAAQGMLTTLHYADGLNTPRDNAFRAAYAKAFKLQPDVYAVQGYDAAQMLATGLERDQGRHHEEGRLRRRHREGEDRQPARRRSRIGKSHNPVQDIYLRKVEGKENKVVERARSRAWPIRARGCHDASLIGTVRTPESALSLLPWTSVPFSSRCLNVGPVRAAAVPGRLRTDADLRHHGRHQPGPRQLLHDRRLHGVRAVVALR